MALRGLIGIIWLAFGLGLLASSASAQESSDCLACHGDPGLTMDRRGKTVNLFGLALDQAGGRRIDYLNPHGTSTPVGDLKEMEAVRRTFGAGAPLISSTKSLTGHNLGAACVQEAIYSLLMLNNGFVCESAHIEELDPAFEDMPIVRKRRDMALER